jgi:hypothetical protein
MPNPPRPPARAANPLFATLVALVAILFGNRCAKSLDKPDPRAYLLLS